MYKGEISSYTTRKYNPCKSNHPCKSVERFVGMCVCGFAFKTIIFFTQLQ